MDIVRKLSNSLVQYVTNEPYILTESYYESGKIKAIDIRSATHEIIENVQLPKDYFNGVFTYKDKIWSISNQELFDKNIENIAIETKRLSDEKIAILESAGVDVDYLDNTFHFTREMAAQLLGATQLSEKLGAQIVEWKNNNSAFVEIPLAESYTICGSALQQFIAIHKNN
tara:strand:+ start:585 stop:1097 length:513 start_codon:yes stop_codon:yes gene_type:complete